MGCFYSKVGPPRTTAFSRDLSLSIKKRIADYPPFEDLLSTRAAKADHRHLFSLFYSIKLKSQERPLSSSSSSSSSSPSSPSPETINAWELMADLDDPDPDQDPKERRPPSQDHPADPGTHLDLSPETHLGESTRLDLSESEQRSEGCASPPPDLAELEPREGEGKGGRRRAAAARLKLKVPSFDFGGAGDGEEELAEPYETPRFGRYGRRRGAAEEAEEGAFEAELVAEFEEALERLTEEEEDVLRRIVEECMLEAEGGN